MASKNEPVNEMTRSVVSVGIDFTPVLMDAGDGTVWEFNPDPSPSEFGALQRALSAFGSISKAAEAGEEFDMEPLAADLSEALSALLVKATQRKTWATKSYGIIGMQRIAAAYVPAISGTPTK